MFQGTTKTKVLDHKIFDGDIRSNFNNALLYLQSHLNTEYIIKIKRTEKLDKLSKPEIGIFQAPDLKRLGERMVN